MCQELQIKVVQIFYRHSEQNKTRSELPLFIMTSHQNNLLFKRKESWSREGDKTATTQKNWYKIRFIEQRKAVTAIKCNKYCLLNISASHILVPGHLSSNFSYQSEF